MNKFSSTRKVGKERAFIDSVYTQTSCPLCGSSHLSNFLNIDAVPVSVGTLWPTQEAAKSALVGDIKLMFCHQCGFIFNRTFEPAKVVYAPGYEISLHHSPLYRHFLEETAATLVERYALQQKSVVEIGCGQGTFLRMLGALGISEGYGFDPALEREGVEMVDKTQIAFIRDYYTQQYAHLPHDLICCRHLFNQLANPRHFLATLRRLVGTQTNTVLYFEMPNADYAFHTASTWQVFYERYAYFTAQTLTQMFALCGFEVLRVEPCYIDGQYLRIEATPLYTAQPTATVAAALHLAGGTATAEVPAYLTAYAEQFRQKIALWKTRLADFNRNKVRVVAWGSGGQGITFLNLIQATRRVAYVVDINPERQGKFIPGTGQRVIAPEFLQTYRPDVVLITNPTYTAEIKQQVSALGLTCQFLVT